jgi:hypothetical protein
MICIVNWLTEFFRRKILEKSEKEVLIILSHNLNSYNALDFKLSHNNGVLHQA